MIVILVLLLWWEFKLHCPSNFQVYNTILLISYNDVHQIPRSYWSYNWKFVAFYKELLISLTS